MVEVLFACQVVVHQLVKALDFQEVACRWTLVADVPLGLDLQTRVVLEDPAWKTCEEQVVEVRLETEEFAEPVEPAESG